MSTSLHMIFRAQHIDISIMAGLTACGVVLSSGRQAFDMDWHLVVITDCCAEPEEKRHHFLMERVFPQPQL